tara:strand:+ start:713 stop:1396 length:684 start_codon:yes stop_codon:yes gene_type:complete
MATLTIGGKTVFTQSGTDEPVLSSDITGTLGSGIVFPAGHIVQVQYCTDDTQEDWYQERESLAVPLSNLFVKITPKSANNTMLVQGNVWLGKNNDIGVGLTRRLSTQSFSDSDTRIGAQSGGAEGSYVRPGTHWSSDNSSVPGGAAIQDFGLFGVDNTYNTTNEIIYHVFTETETSNGSGGEIFNYNLPGDGSSHYPDSGRALSVLFVYELQGSLSPQIYTNTGRQR